MKLKPLEKEVLAQCIEWLNYQKGVKVWRQNTGNFKLSGENGKSRFFRAGTPGMADISGIGPKGRRIEIECKRPGKKPTDEQRIWLDLMTVHGGIAFWADSLEMAIEKFRKAL